MNESDASGQPVLYRAVGLNEARDIETFGGFRIDPASGYEGGKWFASSYDDAVRWGRAMQRFPQPRPFRIAAIHAPVSALNDIEFHERWDAIGPAHYVREEQLPALNLAGSVTVFDRVFMPGDET